MNRLLSPSSDRVVRRLRTTIISASRRFQQDVELKVLSATEKELQKEHGMMLGISIMGERLPYSESDHCVTSVLMEQHLDDIGHVFVIASERDAQINELAEVVQVKSSDSISEAYVAPIKSRRFKATRSRTSDSSTVTSVSSNHGNIIANHHAELADLKTGGIGPRSSTSYGDPWKKTPEEDKYLKECSLSQLEDLLCSWNHSHTFCCNWHISVDRLILYAKEMRGWKTCGDTWPINSPVWQCKECSALQFEEPDSCWLCLSPCA